MNYGTIGDYWHYCCCYRFCSHELKIQQEGRGPGVPSVTPTPVSKEPSDEELIANAKKLAAMGEALQQAKAHGDEKTVQEILNMTYTGPLPEKKEDGTYTQIYQ